LEALQKLPSSAQPKEIYGCEVWGDLDWVPHAHIIRLACHAPETLGPSLLRCFKSQVEGGKRYDRAALGRRHAQATFGNPTQPDSAPEVVLALDLRPLVQSKLSPTEFLSPLLDLFRTETIARLAKLGAKK
jgi:hypothetical protein